MPRFELDLDPVQHITADAIGQPGQRIFYLQGWRQGDLRPVTVIIEKIQLQSLVLGLERLLNEIAHQRPELPIPPPGYKEEDMHISPPVDPIFRAGELGLGYAADQDKIVLLAREIMGEGEDQEEAAVVRFWCTRAQAWRLAQWGAEVIQRGRPLCPQCGQPMDPEGHFCPKKNGHKRR